MLLPPPLQTYDSVRNPTTFHGPADDSRPLPLWDICGAGSKLTVGDRNSASLGRRAHLIGMNMSHCSACSFLHGLIAFMLPSVRAMTWLLSAANVGILPLTQDQVL